jgi:ribosomal protein S18 acetylase RimI-like enzyme
MNADEIIVRNARKSDITEVARLHVWNYAMGNPVKGDNFRGRVRFYRDKIELLRRREPGGFFVVESDGKTAGFIMLSRKSDLGLKRLIFDPAAWRMAFKFLFFQYGFNSWFLKFVFRNAAAAVFSILRLNRRALQPAGAPENTGEKKPRKIVKITNIVVHAKYRGRGAAKILLKRAEEYAADSGADALTTIAHVENRAAIQMYASAGFTRRGTCSDSYGESVVFIKILRK